MKFKLSEYEKNLVQQFKQSKYPAIYKTDKTDNILFIESVDFDVCPSLLMGHTLPNALYDDILNEYERYLKNVNLDNFDEYAQYHYEKLLKVMEILKKYNK